MTGRWGVTRTSSDEQPAEARLPLTQKARGRRFATLFLTLVVRATRAHHCRRDTPRRRSGLISILLALPTNGAGVQQQLGFVLYAANNARNSSVILTPWFPTRTRTPTPPLCGWQGMTGPCTCPRRAATAAHPHHLRLFTFSLLPAPLNTLPHRTHTPRTPRHVFYWNLVPYRH